MQSYELITILLPALLVAGNMLMRLFDIKKAQLAFNIIILGMVAAYAVIATSYGYGFQAINTYTINAYSLFFIILFSVGMLLVNILAFSYSDDYRDFALISSFAFIGMLLVAASSSIITIFLGLELATIPSVFIILLSRKGSIEAAAKFFIMASISIAVFSFAAVLLYGSTGSFALSNYSPSILITFAAVLFIASLGMDSSIFPFNVLIPDVYQGSSAYATAMLGGVNKKMGLAALIQIMILVFITDSQAFLLLTVLAVLTMFYGNITAIMQRDLKRMLAYSSISQAGYILIGIVVASPSGISASLFQIFAHMFLFIGTLAIIAWLERKNRYQIDEVIGLHEDNKFAAFALSLMLLSMIGLPFTTGFVGKFLIFLSAVNAGMAWLAIIGIINSVISVFYYAKVIIAMYTSKSVPKKTGMDIYTFSVIAICLAVTLLFGIYPQPIISLTSGAAAYLTALPKI
jgi:NADH-quinone oxidoreductase subunit N